MQRQVHTEAHMAEKGIKLPVFQDAVWSYVKAQRDGNLLYIGDHVGQTTPGVDCDESEKPQTVRGKVGDDAAVSRGDAVVNEERANELARNAGLRLLSTLSHYCEGDLDRVDQVIKVVGIVNGVSDFIGHGKVVNGCSDVLVEVLGDRGRHARTCTGSGSLPAVVTCEMVVRLKDGF